MKRFLFFLQLVNCPLTLSWWVKSEDVEEGTVLKTSSNIKLYRIYLCIIIQENMNKYMFLFLKSKFLMRDGKDKKNWNSFFWEEMICWWGRTSRLSGLWLYCTSVCVCVCVCVWQAWWYRGISGFLGWSVEDGCWCVQGPLGVGVTRSCLLRSGLLQRWKTKRR